VTILSAGDAVYRVLSSYKAITSGSF